MVGLDPVQGVGDQEAAHLTAGEVELVGTPVGVNLVLVEHLAVEGGKTVGVGAKTAGDPVHDHANAGLVAGVNKVHELVRVAVARGGRVVARGLVAPRAVKGVLGQGQDLDVRVAHLLDVVHQLDRKVVVAVVGAALSGEGIARAGPGAVLAGLSLRLVAVALPAAQVDLKDVERAFEHGARRAGVEPLLVFPGVAGKIGRSRGGSRGQLGLEGVGVCLVELGAVLGNQEELVELAGHDAGDEALPNVAVLGAGEGVGGLVPAVELANDIDSLDIGGPDGKVVALLAAVLGGVGAQLLVAAVPLASAEQVDVVVA